jgi:hypothetical protein
MTKPETMSPQAIVEMAANEAIAIVNSFLLPWRKPEAGGNVTSRECVMQLTGQKIDPATFADEHVKPMADALCHSIAMFGVPHSFVAPTWNCPGAKLIAEHTASAGTTGPVIRAVVSESVDGTQALSLLYAARFAAA